MSQEIPQEYIDLFNQQRREMVDTVYGGGHRIPLDTGRIITMKRLDQGLTYAGMLEGVPRHKDICDMKPWINDHTYLLYAPVKRWDLFERISEVAKISKFDLENPPLTLPRIYCSAGFHSDPIEREGIEENDLSYLDLVWYQDEWAMPIAPDVLERLKSFDWDNLARFGWI